jgi:steroid delta-isomerase-like uncharacterized protein
MSTDENKSVIRRWIQALNDHNADAATELLADGYVRHDTTLPETVGSQAQRELITAVLASFPDLHFQIDELLGEDTRVAGRYTVRGTHRGDFLGVPATGRQVTFEMMETYRLTGGKLAEQWVVMDALGLLRQMGAVPP